MAEVESPQVTQCDCCGYEEVECEFYPKKKDPWAKSVDKEDRWLCRLCSHTMTSGWHISPEKSVMEVVCWIGNDIIALIRERT